MTGARPRRMGRNSDERVVRPYALTAGRTRPSGAKIDLIALVAATSPAATAGRSLPYHAPDPDIGPEHLRLLRFCRQPASVADLATTLDLPLGVVRILIADLRDRGLVDITQPAPTGISDVRVLKEVADALRRL